MTRILEDLSAQCDALENSIIASFVRIDEAAHEALTALREYDDLAGWRRHGQRSCAQWLAWRGRIGIVTARERVRIAHALGRLPKIDRAFAEHRLSYAQVRAITRVATDVDEDHYLELADNGASSDDLEAIAQSRRRTLELEATVHDPARIDRQRSIRKRPGGPGLVRFTIVCREEEGAELELALERAAISLGRAEEDLEGDDSAESSEPSDASAGIEDAASSGPGRTGWKVDGLVALARHFLGCDSTESKAMPDRSTVLVHVTRGDNAWLDDGSPILAETARRVACDTGVVPILVDAAGTVVGAGDRVRTIPSATRLALGVRDRGCRFPGCRNRIYVHAHHILHWADGGPSTLENLVLLCTFHHRLVHEYGFVVKGPGANPEFFDPAGNRIERSPALCAPT